MSLQQYAYLFMFINPKNMYIPESVYDESLSHLTFIFNVA